MQLFATFDKLSIHCKEHRSFSCDICYTGFVSEPLLVEHRFNDHPQGRPPWSAPRPDPDITITEEVDPELERVMEVIRTPDPDPFVDKWHPAIGHVKKDDKHKIECEVCHRYLKTFTLRVEHVKIFHPTVFYDCVFCPSAVFYTLWDLLSHCKKNHFVCQQCDSAHIDKNTLQKHMSCYHPEQPAQSGARKGFVCNKCGMYCSTAATFKVHMSTHKKTLCPFCPQKFIDAASRNKHVSVKHTDRGNRKLSCRLAPRLQSDIQQYERSWVSIQDRYTLDNVPVSGVIIKIVLTVTGRSMPWSSIAGLMGRRHGTQSTAQRTRRIGTSVLCVRKYLTKLPSCYLTLRYTRRTSTSVMNVIGVSI